MPCGTGRSWILGGQWQVWWGESWESHGFRDTVADFQTSAIFGAAGFIMIYQYPIIFRFKCSKTPNSVEASNAPFVWENVTGQDSTGVYDPVIPGSDFAISYIVTSPFILDVSKLQAPQSLQAQMRLPPIEGLQIRWRVLFRTSMSISFNINRCHISAMVKLNGWFSQKEGWESMMFRWPYPFFTVASDHGIIRCQQKDGCLFSSVCQGVIRISNKCNVKCTLW